MPDGPSFTIRVDCIAGDREHVHRLEISADGGFVLGLDNVRRTRSAEVEYLCPVADVERKAIFEPPEGYARPYRVVRIS
jgi:hypothetical protein